MLRLVKPSTQYLSSALAGCQEYVSNRSSLLITQPVSDMIKILRENPTAYFYNLDKQENSCDLKNNSVPVSVFWLIEDEKYIGTFALRHRLTDELRQRGGHITCQIIPSKLRQGYGGKGLELCLQEALKLGLEEVLMICSENDVASYKIMQKIMIKMGGREIEAKELDGHKNFRIWVKTKERHDGKIRPLALAIITKDNKILANKGYDTKKKEWFYRLPGGGIDFLEKAEDTLKREFKEENGIDVFIEKQLGVVENIFEFNEKKGHEIAIVFQARLSNEYMKKDKIPLLEPMFEGCFTEFIEINSDYKIYPKDALKFVKVK